MPKSEHPDFPIGTQVIGLKAGSNYYGQRGEVYGAGPNSTGTLTLVWVRWHHNGDCLKHLAKSLAVAALDEAEYKTSSRTVNGKKITYHVLPGVAKHARPTVFQRSKPAAFKQNPAREA